MKKFIFFPLFLLLFIFILAPSVNAACQGLPPIPVSIAPTEGNFNTNYVATIKWEEMTPADFSQYENIDAYLGLFDSKGTPISAGSDTSDKAYGRKQKNSLHNLNSLFLSPGTYTLYLHLFSQFSARKDLDCVFEKESPSITVTYDPNSQISQLKVGDTCDPILQGSSKFSCPVISLCQSAKQTDGSLKWTCTGEINNSLPPCSQWAYFYPQNDPNSRLNNVPIPTEYPEFVDPTFTTKRCIEVQTGINKISTEPQGFVKSVFGIVLGLAGGIALVLIMLSGYKFMTSQGNPEALKAAQEELVAAIVGLLFIIFSFVILQTIGDNLLRIPGFAP